MRKFNYLILLFLLFSVLGLFAFLKVEKAAAVPQSVPFSVGKTYKFIFGATAAGNVSCQVEEITGTWLRCRAKDVAWVNSAAAWSMTPQ